MRATSSPPPSSDKKSNHSNTIHAWISLVWWIPYSFKFPLFFIIFTLFILSFSAASNPPPTPTPTPTPTLNINHHTSIQTLNSKLNTTLSISIVITLSVSVLFLMAWFGCFGFKILSRKSNRVVNDDLESETGSNLGGVVEEVKIFSWEEVQICTKGFEKVIDSGGFSVVYYGTLNLKEPIIGAFKVHSSSQRLSQGFNEELGILLKLHHPNIVKLYGYCNDLDGERGALMFEYVPCGTLQQHLQWASVSPLPWKKRTVIAYQLALALEYLHDKCELHVVHGDIKSSNILLDSNFNVKLCDFGSAKMGFSAAITPPRKHLITGSPGYVDPHYIRTGIASKKNDIFSFGVVVMELLTGLEALCNKTGRMLTSQVMDRSGHVNQTLVDPRLGGEFDLYEARVMGEIAAMCVRGSPSLRPSASEVLEIMMQNLRGLEN